MKEKTKRANNSANSDFLQKFSGKLNIITKHGQIKDQTQFKLPIINSPQSKRANTMLFRASKQSMRSFFSEGRSVTTKSSIQKSRADKFLTHNIERDFTDISNHFMKNPAHHNLKKSGIKHHNIEPLSALPLSKKFTSTKDQTNRIQQQNMPSLKISLHNNRNHDYENFLNELNSVSHVVKNRKVRSQIERNDRLHYNN